MSEARIQNPEARRKKIRDQYRDKPTVFYIIIFWILDSGF
jgi:hypothetical protein